MECIEGFGLGLYGSLHILNGLTISVGKLSGGRYYPSEEFVCEDKCSVDEVAKDRHKLIIVAGLEVSPCEVVVLGFGCIGSEYVT